jgi:hypothetical protein
MWSIKVVTVGIWIALGLSTMSLRAEDLQAARAIVSGPEDRVFEYHKNLMEALKKKLGRNDPAAIGVSCDLPSVPPAEFNCDKLDGDSSDSTKVIYTLFRDNNQKRLSAFVEAWDELQTRKLDSSLTIQFDTNTPPGDCGGFTGACVNAPFCPGPPKRCDKVQGPPCTACGT